MQAVVEVLDDSDSENDVTVISVASRSETPAAAVAFPTTGQRRARLSPPAPPQSSLPPQPLVQDPTLADLDHRFQLKACERSLLLADVFSGAAASALDGFRKKFERERKAAGNGDEGTLWQLVQACSQDRVGQAALPKTRDFETESAPSRSPSAGRKRGFDDASIVLVGSDDEEGAAATAKEEVYVKKKARQDTSCVVSKKRASNAPRGARKGGGGGGGSAGEGGGGGRGGAQRVGMLERLAAGAGQAGEDNPANIPWPRAVGYFRRRLAAAAAQVRFEAELCGGGGGLGVEVGAGKGSSLLEEGARSASAPLSSASAANTAGLFECGVCSDKVGLGEGAFCSDSHFACRPCWWNYMTKTERALSANWSLLTAVPCFMPPAQCPGGLLPPYDARRCLGPLDRLDAAEREQDTSRRVALAGGRSVYCGRCRVIVGVVSEARGDNPTVACPHCGDLHCTKCGTSAHGKQPCPPSKAMDQFLSKNAKNTKRCPNCGIGVTKNGGCNHMTCAAAAGGCGHDFCWLCLGPYPRCGCGHFEASSARLAQGLAGGAGRRPPPRQPPRQPPRRGLRAGRNLGDGDGWP